MEVQITKQPEKSQVVLNITVPLSDFTPYLNRSAKKLSNERPIKGFRPGKVPIAVAQEQYGTEALVHMAIDLAIPNFFIEAVMDNGLEAINRPAITVEEVGIDKPLRFTATVDVLPDAVLGDITKLKIEKRPVLVNDKDVEKELSYLAKSRSSFQDVTRGAKEGDIVTIDFEISMDGTPIEGGISKQHPVPLGEGQFVPEFEAGLKDIKAQEERAYEMKFPEDYGQEELRGKQAQVKVKAHTIQERLLPELNDEFAKKLGKFTDMAHLKTELHKGITLDKEQKENERYQAELAEALAMQATYTHIPEILIEQEISHRLEEFSQMLAYQQRTIEDYLLQQKKTIQDVRNDMRDAATRNVKIGLAMRTFAKEYKIEATEAEILEEIQKYISRYPSVEDAKKQLDMEKLTEEITSMLRNRKSLAKLEELIGKK